MSTKPANRPRRIAEALLRRIVPEWRDRPIYVVLGSDGPDAHRLLTNAGAGLADGVFCAGLFDPGLCGALRPTIETTGRWQGRGFACLVRDDLPTDLQTFCIIATALHEAAHALAMPGRRGRLSDADLAELPPAQAALIASLETVEHLDRTPGVERPRELPPWIHHEARFIRAAAHLFHRAKENRWWMPAHLYSFGGKAYGLSPCWAYLEALKPELDRIDKPIEGILSTEAPDAFTHLWNADTSNVENRNHR